METKRKPYVVILRAALVLSLLLSCIGCVFMSRVARVEKLKSGSTVAVVVDSETENGPSVENLLSASLIDRGMIVVNLRQVLPDLGKTQGRLVDEGDITTIGGVSKILLMNESKATAIDYENEMKLMDTIVESWNLEYVLIVTTAKPYAYNVQLINIKKKRITFSYHVSADAEGWAQNMPDVKPSPNYKIEPPDAEMPLLQFCEHIADLLTE